MNPKPPDRPPPGAFEEWAARPTTDLERIVASSLYHAWSYIGGDVFSDGRDLSNIKVEGCVDFLLLARLAINTACLEIRSHDH